MAIGYDSGKPTEHLGLVELSNKARANVHDLRELVTNIVNPIQVDERKPPAPEKPQKMNPLDMVDENLLEILSAIDDIRLTVQKGIKEKL